MKGLDFNLLPEDTVTTILSLTSPSEACRSSVVSSTFRSAVDSDVVWERFLPADYRDIVSRLVTPPKFSSKKELFFHLCDPTLIDGGKKSFALEKWSGKISYILSARELSIAWGNDPKYWTWKTMQESRFSEVVELRTIRWLEVHGKMKTKLLSPNTTYGAYFIMKTSKSAYGLNSIPVETSVEVGNIQVSGSSTTYLRSHKSTDQKECLFYTNGMQMSGVGVMEGDRRRVPLEREDGWMEIELGEFYNGEGDEEVKMSLMEVKGDHLKRGLIIEGIEMRPKH